MTDLCPYPLPQLLQVDEAWLKLHPSEDEGYQETMEEVAVLEAYIGELKAQAFALDDILLELLLERKCWDTPDLLLAS